MSAIILDGHLKSALSAVRSLGQNGILMSVGAERSSGMALHSKYAKSTFVYPSPYENQRGFIETVKEEATRLGGNPVIYAFSDATWLSIYHYRDMLKDCATLVYPDEKSIEIAFDKAATYSLARVSGVPTIPTQTPITSEEVVQCANESEYPVVLKSKKSVTWKDGKGIFGTAQFIHSKNELIEEFRDLKNALGETPFVQKFVTGEEYGVEMLACEGKIYASVVHHRLRSLSPTGGASVLKETLMEGNLKNELTEYAQILVEKLAWTGPIMVEFKVESDSRKPYLMEINARFWGSLPLSLSAGVDFPYLYYLDVTKDERPTTNIEGREGIISNHFMGSCVHLMRVFIARDKMRKKLYPSRTQAIKDFLFLPRYTKSDVWSFKDPMPAIMEIVDIVKKLWKSN